MNAVKRKSKHNCTNTCPASSCIILAWPKRVLELRPGGGRTSLQCSGEKGTHSWKRTGFFFSIYDSQCSTHNSHCPPTLKRCLSPWLGASHISHVKFRFVQDPVTCLLSCFSLLHLENCELKRQWFASETQNVPSERDRFTAMNTFTWKGKAKIVISGP